MNRTPKFLNLLTLDLLQLAGQYSLVEDFTLEIFRTLIVNYALDTYKTTDYYVCLGTISEHYKSELENPTAIIEEYALGDDSDYYSKYWKDQLVSYVNSYLARDHEVMVSLAYYDFFTDQPVIEETLILESYACEYSTPLNSNVRLLTSTDKRFIDGDCTLLVMLDIRRSYVIAYDSLNKETYRMYRRN